MSCGNFKNQSTAINNDFKGLMVSVLWLGMLFVVYGGARLGTSDIDGY